MSRTVAWMAKLLQHIYLKCDKIANSAGRVICLDTNYLIRCLVPDSDEADSLIA
jgi:hypothetical protein